jgi:hypothetical protein
MTTAAETKSEASKKGPPAFPGLAEFFNNASLYAEYQFTSLDELKSVYGGGGDSIFSNRFDGHCPYCNKVTTFTFGRAGIVAGVSWHLDNIRRRHSYERCDITCARNDNHTVYFWLRLASMKVQKVGQYPSLADIANDESKEFRGVLSKENSGEFHKAIGLAAHGVGIGSFVYLRRIFERLIQKRFDEHSGENSWKAEDFKRLRMDEKIEFLKKYLPPFLVEHGKIYSILSLGVHELNEENCLAYFEVMKNSITIILIEDQQKKEELEQRKKFSQAIKQFSPETSE